MKGYADEEKYKFLACIYVILVALLLVSCSEEHIYLVQGPPVPSVLVGVNQGVSGWKITGKSGASSLVISNGSESYNLFNMADLEMIVKSYLEGEESNAILSPINIMTSLSSDGSFYGIEGFFTVKSGEAPNGATPGMGFEYFIIFDLETRPIGIFTGPARPDWWVYPT